MRRRHRRRWSSEPPPGLLVSLAAAPRTTSQELSAASRGLVGLLEPCWVKGQRHDLSLALACVMGRHGWAENDALRLVWQLVQRAGDPEWSDRRDAITDTYRKLRSGGRAAGWRALQSVFDNNDLQILERLLAPPATSTAPLSPEGIPAIGQALAEVVGYINSKGAGYPISVALEELMLVLSASESAVKARLKRARRLRLIRTVRRAGRGGPQMLEVTVLGRAAVSSYLSRCLSFLSPGVQLDLGSVHTPTTATSWGGHHVSPFLRGKGPSDGTVKGAAVQRRFLLVS